MVTKSKTLQNVFQVEKKEDDPVASEKDEDADASDEKEDEVDEHIAELQVLLQSY